MDDTRDVGEKQSIEIKKLEGEGVEKAHGQLEKREEGEAGQDTYNKCRGRKASLPTCWLEKKDTQVAACLLFYLEQQS